MELSKQHLDEIDIKYHWDMISNLLKKFGLVHYIKKKALLQSKIGSNGCC